jgi:hypothetical protein
MRTITSVIAALICVVIAAGVSAASASATEPVWVVNGHTLKSGETRTVKLKLTNPKVKWEDGTTKFEIECKKATGESELKGGFPGTDQVKALTFEECSLIKGGTSCKISGTVSAEELPGWPTTLSASGATDSYTGVRFSLILASCEKGSFNKTWIFKGPMKATQKVEGANVHFTLPTIAGGAELETEGDEASLSGPGELEDKSAAKLSFEEAKGHWFNEAGERFAEGVPVATTFESLNTLAIGAKLEGVEVEITCPVLEGEGTIENEGVGKNGFKTVAKKCTVPKPGGTCKVLKESFHMSLGVFLGIENTGELVYKGTAIFDKLPNTSATITIEGCSNSSLNKAWTLSGTAIAEPVAEKSSLKFSGTSGSEVKLGGHAATFTSEDKIEVEGGGKIQVG